jgi:hypothetical protein
VQNANRGEFHEVFGFFGVLTVVLNWDLSFFVHQICFNMCSTLQSLDEEQLAIFLPDVFYSLFYQLNLEKFYVNLPLLEGHLPYERRLSASIQGNMMLEEFADHFVALSIDNFTTVNFLS